MAATERGRRETAGMISESILDAYNEGELDGLDGVVVDDFVCHLTGGGELDGIAEYRAHVEATREAFPDLRTEVAALLVDGDLASVHYRWSGTHEGEFRGVPGTGRTVDATSLTLIRVVGERMAEMWLYSDGPTVADQLEGE